MRRGWRRRVQRHQGWANRIGPETPWPGQQRARRFLQTYASLSWCSSLNCSGNSLGVPVACGPSARCLDNRGSSALECSSATPPGRKIRRCGCPDYREPRFSASNQSSASVARTPGGAGLQACITGAKDERLQRRRKNSVCMRFVSGHDFSRADKWFILVILSRL